MTVQAVWRGLVRVILVIATLTPSWASAQSAPPAVAGPTLQAIRDRGHLICATADPLPGFAQPGADGRWTGFDVDFCRAVAVAVFNDASKMEFVPLSGDSRFAQLQTGS